MTAQGEPVDVVFSGFSKALVSAFHRLLVKKVLAVGIHLNITRCVEEYLQKISTEIVRPPLERRHR